MEDVFRVRSVHVHPERDPVHISRRTWQPQLPGPLEFGQVRLVQLRVLRIAHFPHHGRYGGLLRSPVEPYQLQDHCVSDEIYPAKMVESYRSSFGGSCFSDVGILDDVHFE
ncbi:unnamed protein product [Callosobruchus maculatus]|uniref:Uncharacterized protein n=1 Tax=Callosobruchus maculatus TaxID=64391 RepID=A0A653BK49_CALMS|nr:unnamed protein product [Callosobruchus maculatus]